MIIMGISSTGLERLTLIRVALCVSLCVDLFLTLISFLRDSTGRVKPPSYKAIISAHE